MIENTVRYRILSVTSCDVAHDCYASDTHYRSGAIYRAILLPSTSEGHARRDKTRRYVTIDGSGDTENFDNKGTNR